MIAAGHKEAWAIRMGDEAKGKKWITCVVEVIRVDKEGIMDPLFPDLTRELQDLERTIAIYRTVFIIVSTIFWFASAGLAAYVASVKGWQGKIWFLFGLLFGFLTLVAAAGLPVRERVKVEKEGPVGLGRPQAEEDTSELNERIKRLEGRL
ncbi:MAG: hypothetical protein PHI18_04500 [bacterium]|nr:hypothetical protein [bacterium]